MTTSRMLSMPVWLRGVDFEHVDVAPGATLQHASHLPRGRRSALEAVERLGQDLAVVVFATAARSRRTRNACARRRAGDGVLQRARHSLLPTTSSKRWDATAGEDLIRHVVEGVEGRCAHRGPVHLRHTSGTT